MIEAVRVARLLGVGALAAVAVAGHASAARAAGAVEAGWWTASPLAVAADAPADGLVVEGGVADALTYGAVRFTLAPDETPESLAVHLAPGSASTPSATLALCPLTEPFTPTQGGPMADAPAYDCGTTVEAAPSGDGTTYTFDVAALVVDGALAVAILPTAATDRVVLASPGAGSLITADAASPASPTATSPAGAAAADDDVASPAVTSTPSSGATPAPRPTSAARAPAVTSSPAAAQAPAVATTPAGSSSPAAAPVAQVAGSGSASWLPPVVFVGLAALAAALWLGRRAGDDGDDVVSVPQPA